MEGVRIYGTIPNLLKEQLDKKLFDGEYTISQALSLALHQWLNSPSEELYPEAAVFTQADLNQIRDFFKSQPIREPEHITVPEEPIQKGLIMPDMSKTRTRPDPDIKNSFHLSHDIRPGDGVTGRLKAIGVDPLSIIKARRNKQRGRDYDKSLEQYFDLL